MGEFQVRAFDELTTRELYEILRARADVFVGEEEILYPDADGLDYGSLHVFSWEEAGSASPGGEPGEAGARVASYLRMFPKPDEPGVVQMGRVLTRVHGRGLGARLLACALGAARGRLGAHEVYLESQKHAQGFYEKAGFEVCSDDFIEAGIPHVQMRRKV